LKVGLRTITQTQVGLFRCVSSDLFAYCLCHGKALILAAAVCFLERGRGAFAAGLVLTLLAPAGALAGAWTDPAGQGQIIETLFGWAGDGPPYGGVAGGRESRVEAQTYIEYGLADRLTVVGQTALEQYELTAPSADVFRGLDYSSIGLRANLWSNDAVVISAEATAFVPGARDFSRPAQTGNTGGPERRGRSWATISPSSRRPPSSTPKGPIACAAPGRPTNGISM
jgi:hypothetical protein